MILQKHPRYSRLFRKFKFSLKKDSIKYTYVFPKQLRWGFLGLKICESGRLFYNEVEAARRVIQPVVKPFGSLYCVLPLDGSLTKKKIGSRMGRGKASIVNWYSVMNPGVVIFEVCVVKAEGYHLIRGSLVRAIEKISLKTKVVDAF